MVDTTTLATIFARARPYAEYLATAKAAEQDNWQRFAAAVSLTPAQRDLISAFTRRMNILVISGSWCGDCVQQCPMLEKIEHENPAHIALRFVDRDEEADLSSALRICGGRRVPIALFLNEDFEFVSLLGDRTLTRYRAIASRQLGPSCPLPGAPVPPDEIAATLQDWVNEFERVQLLLRLSPKLRERHAD